jgi:imidazolonepropionase-like amidohydrolase
MRHRHASRVRSAAAAVALLASLVPSALRAQFTEPPPPAAYALRNVTLVRGDGAAEPGQTIVVRGTHIEMIARNAPIPADARVLGGDSLFVYPGLVDAAGTLKFEFPRDTIDRARIRSWDPPRVTQGFMPARRVLDFMTATGADGADLRKKGVVAIAVHPPLADPLMTGRGTFVLLRRGVMSTQQLVLQPELAPMFTFRGGRGVYPSTLMAVMAWYRQTFLDAQRHSRLSADATGPSAYDADMAVVQELLRAQGRVYFVANDAMEIRRALALADEYRLKPVIVGGGEAWKVAGELRTRNVPVLVSLDFTKPRRWKPDEKPAEGQEPKPLEPAAAREKKQLEETYANAARLAEAGVTFALVSSGRADLREGARKVVEYGLSDSDALRALTITPAVLLGAPQLARVQQGGAATFVVSDAPLLTKDARVIYTFVEGALEPGADLKKPAAGSDSTAARGDSAAVNAAGTWLVEFSGDAPMREMTLVLTQEGTRMSGTMRSPQGEVGLSGSIEDATLTLTGTFTAGGQSIPMELVGTVSGNEMTGALKTSFGDLDFKARRTGGRS